MIFRTQTGQTGRDAYRYELAAIANKYRELQERFAKLTTTIAAELPEDVTGVQVLSDQLSECVDTETYRKQLPMFETLDDYNLDGVAELLSGMDEYAPVDPDPASTPEVKLSPMMAEKVALMPMLRDIRELLSDAPGTTLSSIQLDRESGGYCVRVKCGSASTLSWVVNALNGADLNDHPTTKNALQVFGISGVQS